MSTAKSPRLYFAYGSNLSPTQMALRCPSSIPVGLAHLPGYTFIINARRYANVVPNAAGGAPGETTAPIAVSASADNPAPDPTHPGVYGVLYTLPPQDEAVLDRCEGVPHAYQKKEIAVDVVSTPGRQDCGATSPSPDSAQNGLRLQKNTKVTALVYIDHERTEPSEPWAEYIDRMNRGVDESSTLFGLPASYVEQVIRPYIPSPAAPIVDTTAIEDPFLERA